MSKKINNLRVKSIILTGAILCSFTQTSLSTSIFYSNFRPLFALSVLSFGAMALRQIIKENKLSKTLQKVSICPKKLQEKTDFVPGANDFVSGMYERSVLIL